MPTDPHATGSSAAADRPLYTLEIELDLNEGTTREQALSLYEEIKRATKAHETHGRGRGVLVTYDGEEAERAGID